MKPSLTLAALIAFGAAAFAPLPAMAQTDFQLYIGSAPPAPMYERAPAVRRGYVWSPGYWAWGGHRHHWVPGSYVVERPGYVYAPPSWRERGGRWYLQEGYWNPQVAMRGGERYYGGDRYYGGERYYGGPTHGHGHGYRERDRDRDGMPDRFERRGRDFDRDGVPDYRDRDLDNDGIANRYDRDRDGDGRPNRYDSRPENPYRR
jgi:hypothetical protein